MHALLGRMMLRGIVVRMEQVPIRQCVDPLTDSKYSDTNGIDAKGHSCAWYHEMSSQVSPNF
eukprot:686063-Rhodomonas_salina.2